ncbi:MAG: SCO family protein [Myxococcota bacterium]
MTSWLTWFAVGCGVPSNPEPLPYYATREFTPQWFATAPDSFHRIPTFALTNQHGREVTEADVAGRVTVASFFFTRCGGICPKLTASLKQVESAFAHDERVVMMSHSVMPSEDTVPVLRAFANRHDITSDRWHLLTGDRTQIYRLGREAYFAEEDLGLPADPDAFLHTENVVLVDGDGHLRGIYNGLNTTAVRQLVADVRTLLVELPPPGVTRAR